MSDVSLSSVVDQLETEDVPSLADFAEEVGGAWPNGWYAANIIEGYATLKGHQFVTEDTVSKNGDSRNLRLCLKITDGKTDRTVQESFNYRTSDFTPERLSFITAAREEYKGTKGRWADADAQRSSLAIAKLGQIQKAVGFTFKRTSGGNLTPAPLIGQRVDVRLGTDENGYNVITAFAPAGTKVKQAAK